LGPALVDGIQWQRLSKPAGSFAPLDPSALAALDRRGLARFIDHTLLKPDANSAAIERLCAEALQFGFAAVCVNPDQVRRCVSLLQGSPVGVATVVGFPLGATTSRIKASEAREFVRLGATELDMVLNIGRLKDRDYAGVRRDMEGVVRAAGGRLVKVIIETGLLEEEEKIAACLLAKAAGVDFVKTSTGITSTGATVEDVQLMRLVVGDALGVKAAGGIRDAAMARAMLAAGATRLGTSNAIAILAPEEC
jgi:deoxyribose-phosphate aldolase